MANKAQAINNFFSGFSWPAYDESTVPDDAMLPYITFETSTSGFDEPVSLFASLWDRSTSWSSVEIKAAQIAEELGEGGSSVPYDNGMLWVKRGSPWTQRMREEGDDGIRRIVLTIEAEFFS